MTKIDITDADRVLILRAYVQRLEEALCAYRWPLKYASTNMKDTMEDTCLEAEDAMVYRHNNRGKGSD